MRKEPVNLRPARLEDLIKGETDLYYRDSVGNSLVWYGKFFAVRTYGQTYLRDDGTPLDLLVSKGKVCVYGWAEKTYCPCGYIELKDVLVESKPVVDEEYEKMLI